jgi:predicted Zn-dependent protease
VVHRVGLALSHDRLRIALPDGKHLDWMLPDLRVLRDQADSDALVLAPAGVLTLARVILRDAALIDRVKAAAPALNRRAPVERKGRLLAWAAGAITSVAVIIFGLVPIMADQLAALLPPEGERALGDATYEQIRTALGGESFVPVAVCESPEGLAALAAMRARIGAEDDLPYPLTVTVLDHDLVNAFALPGGRIIIFRGLIDEARNAEEVAAVFAHEIGHVVNRDPTRDALRLAGSIGVLGLIFGDFAGGTVVLMLANQLINAQYSQSAEAGADDYAHEKLTEAGLPPAALGTFFERLRDEYGDAEGLAAHFASHPQMTARIEAALEAQALAEGGGHTGAPVLDAAQWRALRAICGADSEPDRTSPDKRAPVTGRDDEAGADTDGTSLGGRKKP